MAGASVLPGPTRAVWGTRVNSPVHYEEAQCKTALNRVSGMGFQWSLNPYRGCVHSCHYCFARRYHGYLNLGAGQDFSSVITVKVNFPEVLTWELSAPTWRRETVALGTATDPYQPIEGKYRLTRRALETLHRYRTPVGVVTKGTMVMRDVDVLADMAAREGCTVCFSVTTLDHDLWQQLEPGTPPPWQRLRAMERLQAAGVNAGVLLAPVVPGITDSLDNLSAVVRAAAQHGARFLGTQTLYLKEGTREHFLDFAQREFPGAIPLYERLYPRAYAPRWYQDRLGQQVAGLKVLYGFGDERPRVDENRPVQLAFP